jgi:hypothetical protein
MTTTLTSPTRPMRPAVIGAVLTMAAAGLLTYLALHNPPGAIPLGNNDYDTQFVNDRWITASLLLAVPIFLVSRWSGWLGAATVLVAGGLQMVIAEVTVDRYVSSGWSDGLEAFAYVYGLAEALLFAVAAVVGWVLGRRARR